VAPLFVFFFFIFPLFFPYNCPTSAICQKRESGFNKASMPQPFYISNDDPKIILISNAWTMVWLLSVVLYSSLVTAKRTPPVLAAR
jgi:hypothetical protein